MILKIKTKNLLLIALSAVVISACNSGANAPQTIENTQQEAIKVIPDVKQVMDVQNTAYYNFITQYNITEKVDTNFTFKKLTSTDYKNMSIKYAEILFTGIPQSYQQYFFDILKSRFLINRYGPEEYTNNKQRYDNEFMYYLNKPNAQTKSDKKSQLKLGLFNDQDGIRVIIPVNDQGSLPLSMITANYGKLPLSSGGNELFVDPSSDIFVNVIKDGKNNPGLTWTGLSDGITTYTYQYVMDQVEYSIGKAIGSAYKGSTPLYADDLPKINAALFNDYDLLKPGYKIDKPSPYLPQIANVRYKKYEKEVIIPELKKFIQSGKTTLLDLNKFNQFISGDGAFKAGDIQLDYSLLHELEADYIAYLYNDQDSKPTNITEIKKKAIHLNNLIQSMQMFGDANTRLARSLYYAYLFKQGLNTPFGYKDFAPIMGDSPIYKANLQMLDKVSEADVINFMLNTFLSNSKGFQQQSDKFINQIVQDNIIRILS